jgi:hypothetical protein
MEAPLRPNHEDRLELSSWHRVKLNTMEMWAQRLG